MSATQHTKMRMSAKLVSIDTREANAESERVTVDMTVILKKKDLKLFRSVFGEDIHLLPIHLVAEKEQVITE